MVGCMSSAELTTDGYRCVTEGAFGRLEIVRRDHEPPRNGSDRAFDGAHVRVEDFEINPGLREQMAGIGEEDEIVRRQKLAHSVILAGKRAESQESPTRP